MSLKNSQSLIEKLDEFESQLLGIVDSFGRLSQAAINMYDGDNTKIEDGFGKDDEIRDVSETASLNLYKETEEIATKIKAFEGKMKVILKELPNDEPLKPNASEFDAFLLDYTEKSILKKIKDIEMLLKKRTGASRR